MNLCVLKTEVGIFKNLKRLLEVSLLIIFFTACQDQEKKDGHEGLFTEVSSDWSQLSFVNQIHESETYQPEPQIGLVKGLVESQQKVVKLIAGNPKISKKEMANVIGIGTTSVDKGINSLKKKELLNV